MGLLTDLLGDGNSTSTAVRKAADETINNSTTLQNDDALSLPVAANEAWVGRFVVFHTGDPAADIKFAVTKPDGATVYANSMGARTGDVVMQTTADNAGASMTHGTTTAGQHTVIEFTIINGATAGNLTLQWAQSAAAVADTTVKAGSHLVAHRV